MCATTTRYVYTNTTALARRAVRAGCPPPFAMDGQMSTIPPQLANNATCVRYGLSDAALLAARGAIPLTSPYSASERSVFLPVFLTRPAAPQRAVVWLHGLSGDANTYYCSGVAAVSAAGASSETLSVVPWFGNEQLT